jgi:UDP-N-acetylmuramate dehydrogenase
MTQTYFNLQSFNTFGIEATCTAFAAVESVDALRKVLQNNILPLKILGGGSNVLFTQTHYDTLFIKNNIKGISIVEQSDERVLVAFGAGENWHYCVQWAIENNLGGIENLALIPGTMGAAPMQNIGAYGVELKDVFVRLEAFNLQTFEMQTFTNADCQFGYRESIFKNTLKGKYVITKVILALQKTINTDYAVKTAYGDIQKQLAEKNIIAPTIKDVSQAVIAIRQSKLPDPAVLGNAGSFFKNPTVSIADFEALKKDFPNIIGYETAQGVKLAAGWLIEQCGWKGKRLGAVGVHERQALVLVNYANGTGAEIVDLAVQMQQSVHEKFGVKLQMEVNIL